MSPSLVCALLSVLLAAPALSAPSLRRSSGQAAALDAREASGDIQYSDRARGGTKLWLVERPDRHAAGLAMPVGVATLYSPKGGGNSGDVNHHQSGAEGEGADQGKKIGWLPGNDSDDGSSLPPPSAPLDNELILNHEFANGLQHWEHSDRGSAYTATEFGPIRADSALSKDGIFGVAHNGFHDQRAQGHLQQQIAVPMARSANFSILYNFVTTEYPSWQGTVYNDNFKLILTGPSGEMALTAAEYLNSGSFTPVSGMPLGGWDYDENGDVLGGQTGWHVFSHPRLPLKNGIYTLRIEVNDVGDEIVDSAILVDRVSLR